MDYSASELVLVIGAIGVMLVNMIQAWRTSSKVDHIIDKTNNVIDKTDHVIEKTAEIHTLTNSTNSKLQASLALAEERMRGLEAMLAQLHQEKTSTQLASAVSDVKIEKARAEYPPQERDR